MLRCQDQKPKITKYGTIRIASFEDNIKLCNRQKLHEKGGRSGYEKRDEKKLGNVFRKAGAGVLLAIVFNSNSVSAGECGR